MAKTEKNCMHVVSISLVRDPGVPDEDLVRSLTDWKRMKDEGRKPPSWGCDVSPGTLDGFLRLLTRADVPEAKPMSEILHRVNGSITDCVAMFGAPRGWDEVLAQALSFMAYGLRPGSSMSVSWRYGASKRRMLNHRREFNVVLNGDGEPEVEEVRTDD